MRSIPKGKDMYWERIRGSGTISLTFSQDVSNYNHWIIFKEMNSESIPYKEGFIETVFYIPEFSNTVIHYFITYHQDIEPRQGGSTKIKGKTITLTTSLNCDNHGYEYIDVTFDSTNYYNGIFWNA